MTKKLILLSTALLTCLFFFFSCNKESQTKKLLEPDKNSFSITEAKSWYLNNSSQQPNSTKAKTNAKKINNFYPQWERAITTNDKNYEIVECPLKFDTHPGFIISPSGNTNNNNNNVHGITRLLILKDKKNGSTRSALMNIYSASGQNDSTITYSDKGKHFSGYIFFTDLNGEFINGWLYENGKIIKQSKRSLSSTNTASKALPPPDEDCENFEIRWYEQDCYYYTDGSSECTDWYYLGSTYETECTGGGGGDGGIDPAPGTSKTLEELLAEFDDNIDDSLTHDCLKAILEEIKSLKDGKIGEIINQFSGDIPDWDWKLKEGSLSVNQKGQTELMAGGALTTLDFSKLNKATNLAIARTIIHESIHAYLTVYFRYDPINAAKDYPGMLHAWEKAKHPNYNTIQHDEMVKSFVEEIAESLKEFGQARGYVLDDYIYNDLAWGGLDYNDNSQLSDDDKVRIQNRLSAEQTNSTFDTESPAGKKACN